MLLRKLHFGVIVVVLFASLLASGQSTEFTYQGSLKDGAAAANGNYDMEFRLFDIGGSQLGSTQSRAGVAVSNGIFSVKLDFGSVFPGADRFLEIAVRTSGGGSFTTLSPRQKIDSSPYSVKSLNATNAENATSAVASTNFTGPLSGDVTGTQSTTTVARIQSRNVANTAPTDGQVLKYNAATAQWRPDTDNTGSGGGITGITAGTGLTGGGTTGSVSIAIANSGVGTAQIADNNVTDPKINSVSGAKVTGAVATATNSTQLGGIAANQYVQTTDPRLTDDRSPTLGSPNYIQNTSSPQSSSNFNVSGTGTGNILNATTQFNLNGSRFIAVAGTKNTFVGLGTGAANAGGSSGSFFGAAAGASNTTGSQNSFFGDAAGAFNSTGAANSFFGASSGRNNTTGTGNSFFGEQAGVNNTTAGDNSFFGDQSGFANTTGIKNSFFGSLSGGHNTGGGENSFFGYFAGNAVTTGNGNSFFGNETGSSTTTGTGNSFFGWLAGKSNSTAGNNSFFGYNSGFSNTTGTSNTFFGALSGDSNSTGSQNAFFGNSAGGSNTTGGSNSFFGLGAGDTTTTGSDNAFFGTAAGTANTLGTQNTFIGRSSGQAITTGLKNTALGYSADFSSGTLTYATAIGADSTANTSNSIFLGRSGGEDTVRVPGNLNVTGSTSLNGNLTFANGGIASFGSANIFMTQLAAGVGTTLCRTASNQIVTCSSSLRYKTNLRTFRTGLDLIQKLRPVTFDWKDGGTHDLGLGAEDVAAIEPLLVTYNSAGQVEGVKYDRIGVVLINAIKEQQEQIRAQQLTINSLEQRLSALEKTKKRKAARR